MTVRFDAPTQPLAIFGLQWTGDYGEPARVGTIAGARFHAQFNTAHPAGAHPDAADILFQIQLPTTTTPFWDIHGSDLVWAGQGSFTGELSTNAFNGEELLVDPSTPLPQQLQLWFARIVTDDPINQQLGGVLTNTYWEFDLNVVPAPGTGMVLVCGFAGVRGRVLVSRRRREARAVGVRVRRRV